MKSQGNTKVFKVIGACPVARNAGMLVVDMAANQLLSSLFPKAKIERLVVPLGPLPDYGNFGLGFEYADLNQHISDLHDCSAIIFWGDFLHARAYLHTELMPRGVDKEQAYRALFLTECDDSVLEKSILFGGSLITDNAYADLDSEYINAAQRLLSMSHHAYFRDVFSAMRAQNITEAYERDFLGIDGAMLFDYDLVPGESPIDSSDKNGQIGLFFSRTNLNLAHSFKFTLALGRADERAVEWLQWLPSDPNLLNAIQDQFPLIEMAPEPDLLDDIFEQIRSCAYIVTDTYHLSMVAWRLGVPAICIGVGAQTIQRTVHDKKKEVVYSMYGASPFYLFAELFADQNWQKQIVPQMINRVHDGELTHLIQEKMVKHAEGARLKFQSALADILNSKMGDAP